MFIIKHGDNDCKRYATSQIYSNSIHTYSLQEGTKVFLFKHPDITAESYIWLRLGNGNDVAINVTSSLIVCDNVRILRIAGM